MRAVRVSSGRTHLILNEDVTYCGRFLVDLRATEELPAEALPGGEEICVPCERTAKTNEPIGAHRVTLPPSLGYLRTTGELYHGFGGRRGRRLG